MPVLINEVIIKAMVDPSANGNTTAANCAPGNSDGSESGISAAENEIAEKVLEIINEKKER